MVIVGLPAQSVMFCTQKSMTRETDRRLHKGWFSQLHGRKAERVVWFPFLNKKRIEVLRRRIRCVALRDGANCTQAPRHAHRRHLFQQRLSLNDSKLSTKLRFSESSSGISLVLLQRQMRKQMSNQNGSNSLLVHAKCDLQHKGCSCSDASKPLLPISSGPCKALHQMFGNRVTSLAKSKAVPIRLH